MYSEEKQKAATIAIELIRLLRMCDDENFVNEVVSCVQNGDEALIVPYAEIKTTQYGLIIEDVPSDRYVIW